MFLENTEARLFIRDPDAGHAELQSVLQLCNNTDTSENLIFDPYYFTWTNCGFDIVSMFIGKDVANYLDNEFSAVAENFKGIYNMEPLALYENVQTSVLRKCSFTVLEQEPTGIDKYFIVDGGESWLIELSETFADNVFIENWDDCRVSLGMPDDLSSLPLERQSVSTNLTSLELSSDEETASSDEGFDSFLVVVSTSTGKLSAATKQRLYSSWLYTQSLLGFPVESSFDMELVQSLPASAKSFIKRITCFPLLPECDAVATESLANKVGLGLYDFFVTGLKFLLV